MRFVDTNVFIRFLTGDDADKARACFELFQRVKRGQDQVTTSEAVLAEVVYVLSSKLYKQAPAEISARLKPILTLRGLHLPHKRGYLAALDLYASIPGLDFEDALTVTQMHREGMVEIFSYDTDFDRVPAITRIEPPLTDS